MNRLHVFHLCYTRLMTEENNKAVGLLQNDEGTKGASGKAAKADQVGLVKRQNDLVLARFRISVQARRLFMFVLAKVKESDNEETKYTFPINQLATAIGVPRSNLYRDMVGVLEELEASKAKIPVKGSKDEFFSLGLISNIQKYRVNKNDEKRVAGEVTIYLHKQILPYLQDFAGGYTSIDLKYFMRLRSTFSQRLYDLLKWHAFKQQAWRVSREELRDLLVLHEGEYANWADFRRYVLEQGQKDIETYTDLAFSMEYVKAGQTVTDVIFRLRKEGGRDVNLLPGTDMFKWFKAMTELGMAAKDAEALIQEWWDKDADRVAWHVTEAKRLSGLGKVASPVGWLKSGLKDDYRPRKSIAAEIEEQRMAAAEQRLRYEAERRSAEVGVAAAAKEMLASFADVGRYDRPRDGGDAQTRMQG